MSEQNDTPSVEPEIQELTAEFELYAQHFTAEQHARHDAALAARSMLIGTASAAKLKGGLFASLAGEREPHTIEHVLGKRSEFATDIIGIAEYIVSGPPKRGSVSFGVAAIPEELLEFLRGGAEPTESVPTESVIDIDDLVANERDESGGR